MYYHKVLNYGPVFWSLLSVYDSFFFQFEKKHSWLEESSSWIMVFSQIIENHFAVTPLFLQHVCRRGLPEQLQATHNEEVIDLSHQI